MKPKQMRSNTSIQSEERVMMQTRQIHIENKPLYFVPTAILCYCGQNVMLTTGEGTKFNIRAMCTNPLCSENLKEKKIDLSKFAFTEYEVLDS